MIRKFLYFVIVVACAAAPALADDRHCSNKLFTIDAQYDAGAFARCKFKADDVVELTIKPEDHKVVIEQPWFSFNVTSRQPDSLTVRLRFSDGYARFWPKLSSNGKSWTRAADGAVSTSHNGKEMEVVVATGPETTWVSAQELLAQPYYDAWLAQLDAHPELTVATIGQSVEGRPIRLAKTDNKPEVILLLGRQHPAEVPGAIAMRDFVDTVLGDSELATAFRQRYTLLIVPLMNPDGVANGHWRHNSGRTDLNRDWGVFRQPETQAVARLMAGVEKLGMRPRLMLDFHATKFTESMLFYTQDVDEVTDPADVDDQWFARVSERAPGYAFKHNPRPSAENPNTKGYFYRRYGIPAFTYEVGDEADRDKLRDVTPVFAEEMMRVMLQAPQQPVPADD